MFLCRATAASALGQRGLLFRRHLIKKILRGEKTRTIRPTGKYKVGRVYAVQERPGAKKVAEILITGKRAKKLGMLTPEDIEPDGYNSLESFKREWLSMYGRWDPEQQVWLYDFKVVRSWATAT